MWWWGSGGGCERGHFSEPENLHLQSTVLAGGGQRDGGGVEVLGKDILGEARRRRAGGRRTWAGKGLAVPTPLTLCIRALQRSGSNAHVHTYILLIYLHTHTYYMYTSILYTHIYTHVLFIYPHIYILYIYT